MPNLSSQKLFLGLAALAGVGLIIVALTSFRPQSEPQVVTPPPAPPVAVAKVPKKIGIIQWVPATAIAAKGFKEEMEKLGYKEGVNVVYTEELAKGDNDKLKAIAEKFVSENVDMIVAVTSRSFAVALEETKVQGKTNIPIVFTNAEGAVETGLVQSYKSSGNNSTGIVANAADVLGKKLEFLQRINPSIKKIAFLSTPNAKLRSTPAEAALAALPDAAARLNMTLVHYKIQGSDSAIAKAEVLGIINNLKPGDIDAFLEIPTAIGDVISNPDEINLGKRLKIPVVALSAPTVEQGALFSYQYDAQDQGRQAAVIADKIFKGTKPSDIPLEPGKKFLLVLNLKTAKEIGVTIPDSLLAIADKKIE